MISARLAPRSAGWANGTMAIGRAAVSPPDTVISRPACAGAQAPSRIPASILFIGSGFWNKSDGQVAVEHGGVRRFGQGGRSIDRIFHGPVQLGAAAALLD